MPETDCGWNDIPGGIPARICLQLYGPTLLVDIGFDPHYDHQKPSGPPQLAETKLWALVDTGATESCIDSDLAKKLQLPVVDRRQIGGVSGPREVDMHLGQIHIPQLNTTVFGSFAGVDLIAGGQRHYALIGRTFLSAFFMTYDGRTGAVKLSNQRP